MQQMNTNYSFILTAAVLVTSAFAISVTSVPFQTAAAAPDRCYSLTFAEGTSTGIACSYSPNNKEASKEFVRTGKDICQEQKADESSGVEKCSSSQTGFGTGWGEFNNLKPKKELTN
jgi:hypothetical protein